MIHLQKIRRHLHAHPELSMTETKTHKYIWDLLQELDADKVEKAGKTGILVTFLGKKAGKNLLVRGDMDALPIQETNDFGHKSTIENISHKCGHDGHTTILYGLAEHFSQHKPEQGNVYLIFQPGEENGRGAADVIASKILEPLKIDYAIALHNLPGYPLHQVVCRVGSFSSSVVSLSIKLKGYTAHAAEPWNGRNPAAAMAKIMLESLNLNVEKPATHEYTTITPVYQELGTKDYGISAGEGMMELTIRAHNQQKLDAAIKKIREIAKDQAKDSELEVQFEMIEPFEANQNNEKLVSVVEKAAEELKLSYHERQEAFRWGEDFGLFTGIHPGAMFGIGSGEDCPPLHNAGYDFPDEITQDGINMFATIFKKIQSL